MVTCRDGLTEDIAESDVGLMAMRGEGVANKDIKGGGGERERYVGPGLDEGNLYR
jgi:hypothetical protein